MWRCLLLQACAGLNEQYYGQLAREAAESGAKLIEMCWKSGIDISTAAVLTPHTNRNGTVVATLPSTVVANGRMTSMYKGRIITASADGNRLAQVTGTVILGSGVTRNFTSTIKVQRTLKADPDSVRASQRFWYFGIGAGLDFGTFGSNWPTTIYSAAGVEAFEGSTVVTNKKGELVFWTDGRTIWNNNGNIASNSTGLLGSSSATQAASAFPLNQEQTRYGIVSNTTGSIDSEYTGTPFTAAQKWRLYFSVYDTTLDNGNGGIVPGLKNIDMYPAYNNASFGGYGYASEALNVIPNHDGSGYWVYTYSKDVPGAPSGNRVLRFLVKTDGTIDPLIAYSL